MRQLPNSNGQLRLLQFALATTVVLHDFSVFFCDASYRAENRNIVPHFELRHAPWH